MAHIGAHQGFDQDGVGAVVVRVPIGIPLARQRGNTIARVGDLGAITQSSTRETAGRVSDESVR